MTVRLVLVVLLLAGRPAAAVDRVVSLNLCTDQMLVLLAPGKAAGLSVLARDPALSFVAAQAAALPIARTSVEAVLRLRPDLVLAARYGAQATLSVLEQEGVRVERIDLPTDWPGVRRMTRDLAGLLGEPERGEALIAAMDAVLRAGNGRGTDGTEVAFPPSSWPSPDLIRGSTRPPQASVAPSGGGRVRPGHDGGGNEAPATAGGTTRDDLLSPHRTAVALEPRLYLAGPDTILGAAMRAAGLTPATDSARTTLETLVRHPPDLLVVPIDPAFPSLATDLLDHPALRGIPRRIVPPNLTICPGPFSAQAVTLLRS